MSVLRDLAARLEAAASGEAQKRALARVREELVAFVTPILADHRKSGAALDTLEVAIDGDRLVVKGANYLKFHAWWPLRDGIPAEIQQRALEIFREEAAAVLGMR